MYPNLKISDCVSYHNLDASTQIMFPCLCHHAPTHWRSQRGSERADPTPLAATRDFISMVKARFPAICMINDGQDLVPQKAHLGRSWRRTELHDRK
ncbi:predicted protein [Sclerotinia sclerotiorum 1980 UF-70]|uniref:Uncharacterized protein n=1 Tax=Sclerotinia sclerotiorum (strain ATCC 18683 / 1980 / Ss-1) TaxID=665079 RepID=A7E6M7_SCLS1|nr:predicted protein [Sclerotinia sclerotiorum 1980 UF-70]EDN91549.1 predicted protein [Sclerotinia sclerotiorum 1980 UF-70]